MFAKRIRFLLLLACLCLAASSPALAQGTEPGSVWQRETLTDNFVGIGDVLAARGVEVGLSATNVYQHLLHGGMDAGNNKYTFSYDLAIGIDLDVLLGLSGASIGVLAEGSHGDGLDAAALGTLTGINDDAGGDRFMDVTELWFQQDFAGGRASFRIGKIDQTGGFDCQGAAVGFDGNAYANDETAQFLSGALVNNPSVAFPDNGIGFALFVEPVDGFYAVVGASDAEADARETGLNTTFDGDTHFVYLAEVGTVQALDSDRGPLPGAYRLGAWNRRMPSSRLDGSGTQRDDWGLYLSADQMLWRENGEDEQGLGFFARFGVADEDVNVIHRFYSVGAAYQGLVPERNADVLGLGVALSELSDDASLGADHETIVEAYYDAELAPWLHVSPHLQYVDNPGGSATVPDAWVGGLRAQVTF
jgi:porin